MTLDTAHALELWQLQRIIAEQAAVLQLREQTIEDLTAALRHLITKEQ